MKCGELKDYFQGIGYKRLAAVEVDASVSNEHEFNGVSSFRNLLGNDKRTAIPVKILYLSDDDDEFFEEITEFTWYNAREKNPNRNEYRLYYKTSSWCEKASKDDFMVMCVNQKKDTEPFSLTVFIARNGDTIEKQLAWLFGIELRDVRDRGAVKSSVERTIDFFASRLLEKLGIQIEDRDDNLLDKMLQEFPTDFPKTNVFSAFVRTINSSIDCRADVDQALIDWMALEEHAFRVLEKHIVQKKLDQGFTNVDDFVNFSLSILNRRKARAGFALENHLCHIFTTLGIKYSYNKTTENNSKPDFLFPSQANYLDSSFPATSLTMLGVKTSCKDRWRQVLNEAQRIPRKHLLTLEPGISVAQTQEMQSSNLQLVVPRQIFTSYTRQQQGWLINLHDFISVVKSRETLFVPQE